MQPDRPQNITHYGACGLDAGYVRPQTHTQNM